MKRSMLRTSCRIYLRRGGWPQGISCGVQFLSVFIEKTKVDTLAKIS